MPLLRSVNRVLWGSWARWIGQLKTKEQGFGKLHRGLNQGARKGKAVGGRRDR